jgi:Xylose isomerase-like TIM barrel
MDYTRRELGRLLLTSLPVPGLLTHRPTFSGHAVNRIFPSSVSAKPNSTFAGVTVGMNVPYNFGTRTMPVDEVIAKTTRLNVSAVELRSQPIELALGVPPVILEQGGGAGAQKQKAEDLRNWRLKHDAAKASAVRTQFQDAGISTDVIKYDGIYDFSDPELDYAFGLAKVMGAKAISAELDVDGAKRVGQFADKHNLMVGYHGHTKTPEAMFEQAFSFAKHNGANLDIGHYVAGNLGNPVDFLKKHHDRITHIHVKDRKAGANGKDGDNVPFGQGDTPITQCLQAIRDNKWPIIAVIEFEYPVPPGSDRMAEMAKCVQYCRQALEG